MGCSRQPHPKGRAALWGEKRRLLWGGRAGNALLGEGAVAWELARSLGCGAGGGGQTASALAFNFQASPY